MEPVVPGLYASAPEPLSFAPSMTVRAFLLQRSQGNLLVYSVGTLAADARMVEELGGISRHYLNHWHEAGVGCDRIASRFKAPLFCHENERSSIPDSCKVAETFTERHMVDDDFEVIPIPGHTSGATAYLWDTGEHRCLFTGDTIYLEDREWAPGLLDSSDREAFRESLKRIAELDFDVLVPWAGSLGRTFHATTDKTDARRRIDRMLEQLGRDDH